MTEQYKDNLYTIKSIINNADAVLIGAGSGLSNAAGLTYSGPRFEENFREFIDKFGMQDMYSAGFYPFATQEEKWAYWSRHIYWNRYQPEAGSAYINLHDIIKDKNYFILTTNVDHQFQKAGFDEEQLFATQGDYGLFQCKIACHKKLYNNEAEVMAMIKHEKNLKIPQYLIPECPVCGNEMEVNLRSDQYFVEDEKWHAASHRYTEFLKDYTKKRIVFIELGVGMNTPGIIKYPFWQMTYQSKKSHYVCINMGEAMAPKEIKDRSICIDADIAKVIEDIKEVFADDTARTARLSGS